MRPLLLLAALLAPWAGGVEVHGFYYLWYGAPSTDGRYLHWDHKVLPHWDPQVQARYNRLANFSHEPPGYLHAPFYPQAGPYSSRDPALLARHFGQMLAHGITTAVLSWTGRPSVGISDTQGVVTDHALPAVLAAAEQTGIKLAFHLEPYPGRSPATVRQDIEYLLARHQGSPALHRRPRPGCDRPDCPELPLFYAYDAYHNPAVEWAELLCEGERGIRGSEWDAVVLSTLLGPADKQLVTDGCFDGAYSYFATDGFTYGASARNWQELVGWAKQRGKLFAPSAGPGYNDTRIRPWNGVATRARQGGRYFERQLAAAVASGAEIISITSFNEWGEGTQIEPAKLPAAGPGLPERLIHTHMDYGSDPNLYLKIVNRSCFAKPSSSKQEL